MKAKKVILAVTALVLALAMVGCSSTTTTSSTAASTSTESSTTNSDTTSTDTETTKEWYQCVDNDWTENFVDLDTGIKMCYMVMGPEDGEPMVLIHGATDSRLSWAQVAPIIADAGYRVYVPELRGHGKTDKPQEEDEAYTVAEHCADIINFMDKVGITDPVNISGHSLGTFISQEIAITHPERVKSITLIATGAKVDDNASLTWCYYGDGESYLGVHGYDAEGAMPDDFIRDWTACTNEDKDFCEGIYLHSAQLPYHVWAHIFGGLLHQDNRERLSAVTCPVQIIWGSEDSIFLESDQNEIKEALTSAEKVDFVEIPGASHNTHWDSKETAQKVADLILGFAV